MTQEIKTTHLFVALALICVLQIPTAQAGTDASVDNVIAMANTSQKDSEVALEVAQLVYGAPLESTKEERRGTVQSKNTWFSNRYFPSVQEMLNTKFFRHFLDQVSESIHEERSFTLYGFDPMNTPEEMVTPTTFTLMGCDPCAPDHTPSTGNLGFQVNGSAVTGPSLPPSDNSELNESRQMN